MARIRSIKPEFRTSLTACQWPRDVRLFFALLWGYLDDHGYGVDEPKLIKPDCFPLDDDLTADDIDKWLDLIAADGSVCRFRGPDGRRYLHAPKWAEHQRPQHPAAPRFPECRSSHETFMNGSHETLMSPISGDSHETNRPDAISAGNPKGGDSHETLTLEGEIRGSRGGGVAERAPARAKPAATLLGNSLLDEHRRLVKPVLPRDVAATLGQRIDSLLDDPEISSDEVREGLRRLRSNRKWGPGMLPNLVHEYRQELAGAGDPADRRQQQTDALFAAAAQRMSPRGDES